VAAMQRILVLEFVIETLGVPRLAQAANFIFGISHLAISDKNNRITIDVFTESDARV
jgi:hypothetical protein